LRPMWDNPKIEEMQQVRRQRACHTGHGQP
jgi:hypothetical protein